jgi:hypothetical protein
MKYAISNVIPSPFDARDYHFTAAAGPLPKRVDLRPLIPDEEDQGVIGSCVAHAAVAACELMTNRAGKWEDLSRRFPYFTGREICGLSGQEGMYPRAVLEAGRKTGFCLEHECAYDVTKVDERPDAAAFASGLRRKIKRYERIPLDPDNFMVSVNNIKAAIAGGSPVKCAMRIGRKMFDLKGPLETHNYISYKSGLPGTELVGGHDSCARTGGPSRGAITATALSPTRWCPT